MAFDPGIGVGGAFQGHTPATRAVAYVFVDDVPAKLAKIETAGGKRLGDPMSMRAWRRSGTSAIRAACR